MSRVSSCIGPSNIPAEIGSIAAMPVADYADLFTLATPDCQNWTAEQWARAMLEDVGGLGAQLLFRVVLRYRLRWRRTSDQVAGWPIAERGADWIRLEARSPSLTCHLVVHTTGNETSLGTFLRYDRPGGRRLWTWLSAKHRAEAPSLLRNAAKRLEVRFVD